LQPIWVIVLSGERSCGREQDPEPQVFPIAITVGLTLELLGAVVLAFHVAVADAIVEVVQQLVSPTAQQ
jgi:hypothetical protein